MVSRRGVGATAASALIFTTLLISGLVVYVSSIQRAGLYAQADAAVSVSDSFNVMEWVGGANVLYQAQRDLAGRTFGCATANQTVAVLVDGLADVQSTGDLTVTVRAHLAGGARADNLSELAPLDGAVPGSLDIALRIAANGSGPPGVYFSRTEVHFVHLGVRLQQAVSDCGRAVSAIAAALAGSHPENCTTAGVGPIVDGAAAAPYAEAAADGLELGVSYSASGGRACSVSFAVSVEQAGIEGLAGSFSMRLEEGESVSLTTRA